MFCHGDGKPLAVNAAEPCRRYLRHRPHHWNRRCHRHHRCRYESPPKRYHRRRQLINPVELLVHCGLLDPDAVTTARRLRARRFRRRPDAPPL